jgi:diaminohydroxyphosphoribosylaminopyrimidine deaminase/5-amino-6-(5-phosphoribosylamino)uracil reductase
VLDSRLDLPLRSRLVVGASETPVLAICGDGAPREKREALLARGVEIETCALGPSALEPSSPGEILSGGYPGRLDLRAALGVLARRGITRVFSEGGPRIGAALIAQGFADEMLLLSSPRPLGRQGVEALSAPSRATLADEASYGVIGQGYFGVDSFIHYERR